MARAAAEPLEPSPPPADEEEAFGDVATPFPSVGRILLLNMAVNVDEQVLRPLIVTYVYEDGAVDGQLFARIGDLPYAYGTRVQRQTNGDYLERCYPGDLVGQWRWPNRT